MEVSRTDFDDMNLNSLINVFNNELLEKFQSDQHEMTPEMQTLELEWSRAYQQKATEQDPVQGKMYNDLMADLMNNIKLGKSSEFVTRVCKAMAASRHPNQPDIIVLLMCRHYTFGQVLALEPPTTTKAKRQKSTRDENLENFEKMITNCGNESGAHLLYNGPCDVIGECVKDLILREQLGIELPYFDRFQSALRPVHCAIMLRNVRILRALTERNLQFEQIQGTCDRRNEKLFQKELHRLGLVPRFDSNLSIEPNLVRDDDYARFYSPLALAAKLYIKMSMFANDEYDVEREKLEEIIKILLLRNFKIVVYEGSNELIEPIGYFIHQLNYFKKDQLTARGRFESLLERIVINLDHDMIVHEAELNAGVLKKMFWTPTRIVDNLKSTKSSQMRTPLQCSSLVNSLKLVRAVMQRLRLDGDVQHEVENVNRIDALTMAIWEYNIPISKTLVDCGFPYEKHPELCGRVVYNAIVMDATKAKTIMTQLVFDKMRNKSPAIKWNFAYDDWFVKKFKNVKLKRFTAKAVNPLVIGLLSQSVDVIRVLLASGCSPDGLDFSSNYGLNKSTHPLHLCYYMAKFGPIHLAPRFQKLFPDLVHAGSLAKFNSKQVEKILQWGNAREELLRELVNADPSSCLLHYDRDFKGLPKCLTKAVWYRINQAGVTKFETILETHGAPIKTRHESVIYQIVAEQFTQKQFDQITQYSMPNFVWEVQPPDALLSPDYIAKGPMTTMQEYLDTGRQQFYSLDLEEPGGGASLASDILQSMVGAAKHSYQQTLPVDSAQMRGMVNHETYLHYLEHRISVLDAVNAQKTVERRKIQIHRDRIWLKGAILGAWVKRAARVKVVRQEVKRTWYNLFAHEQLAKWSVEARLIIFHETEIIVKLIDDIMEKSPVDELCRVFGNIPEHYFGFVSVFNTV